MRESVLATILVLATFGLAIPVGAILGIGDPAPPHKEYQDCLFGYNGAALSNVCHQVCEPLSTNDIHVIGNVTVPVPRVEVNGCLSVRVDALCNTGPCECLDVTWGYRREAMACSP